MGPTSLLLRCEDSALGAGVVGAPAALLACQIGVTTAGWGGGERAGPGASPGGRNRHCQRSKKLTDCIITKGTKAQRKAAYLGHRAT